MDRMNASLARLELPHFDGAQLTKLLGELVKLEKDWIPRGDGFSLYLRPTVIGTHPFIGVGPSARCKLFVICSPVGPYYPEGFKPVSLYADEVHVRAWPGGTGRYKLGSNYGLTIRPQVEAAQRGYAQVLWLFGEQQLVTEVGTMNFFVFWRNKRTGRKELVTAPLDGTILPGVTRQSILDLAREWDEFDVREQDFTIHELVEAAQEKRLLEAFGAGTAAVVAPVKGFCYKDKDYAVPLDPKDPSAGAGQLTKRFWDAITDIQYGRTASEWSVRVQ
jgi:branched-chain amino acid aminotransferase